jgi:hypothetical protein
MEQWSAELHAFIVQKIFKKGDSVVKKQPIFRKHFYIAHHGKVPCRNTTQLLVENFRMSASALKRSNQAGCLQCDCHRTLRL